MKFQPIVQRTRKQQSFDKDKIMITKAGKTYNVYDAIQEAREDTEIYPTLEKYGCIDKILVDTAKTYNDFTAYGELRDLKEQQIKAQNMFYALPHDVRKEFNNNMHTFLKEGKQWVEKRIAEEQASKIETPTITPTTPEMEIK